MRVLTTPSFNKDISRLKDRKIADKVEAAILKMESAKSIAVISGVKKLAGSTNAYRVRIGDYRLGFYLIGDSIRLTIFAHRKEVYMRFP